MTEATTDNENMAHLENCDGCPECDILMQFYSYCGLCGKGGNIVAFPDYDFETGEYICAPCRGDADEQAR